MEYIQTDGGRILKSFKNDCVIRSIAIVLKENYDKVFKELMYLGLEMGAYPSHDKVWIKYIESKGFVKNKPPRDHEGKLIKLKNWDFKGVAIVINSGHLTAVDNGCVFDAWDCRYRPVNSYWTKAG